MSLARPQVTTGSSLQAAAQDTPAQQLSSKAAVERREKLRSDLQVLGCCESQLALMAAQTHLSRVLQAQAPDQAEQHLDSWPAHDLPQQVRACVAEPMLRERDLPLIAAPAQLHSSVAKL